MSIKTATPKPCNLETGNSKLEILKLEILKTFFLSS
jgi:hypothetical protein